MKKSKRSSCAVTDRTHFIAQTCREYMWFLEDTGRLDEFEEWRGEKLQEYITEIFKQYKKQQQEKAT